MSIEAMWAVRYGTLNGQKIDRISGGVVVCETGRLFGGDTWAFYTGKYAALPTGGFNFKVDVGVHFSEGGDSIFGGPLRPYSLVGHGTLSDDQRTMEISLHIAGNPDRILLVKMVRVSELP